MTIMKRGLASSPVVAALVIGSVAPVANAEEAAGEAQVVTVAKPWTFAPAVVHVPVGGHLRLVNLDGLADHGHTITNVSPDHPPLFGSGAAQLGGTVEVTGVAKLPPGTYMFICQNHRFMAGRLVVQ